MSVRKPIKRVFLYGGNPASVMNSLAIGLKSQGCEVRGLTQATSRYINYSEFELFEFGSNRNIWKKLRDKIDYIYRIIRNILWCDVVHICWDCPYFVVLLSWLLQKRRVITFVGSEIRRPAVSQEYNPYYNLAYLDPAYEYREMEDSNDSLQRQEKFIRMGFELLVWDTFHYIEKQYSQRMHIIPHASINVIEGKRSVQGRSTINIVHAPTAPIAKGSRYIIEAVGKLQEKYPFVHFQLLTNISNVEYQQAVGDCDIYVDQLIWGAYGVAAQQALQMGKVVVCYLNKNISRRIYPEDVPIQQATVDTIGEVLEKLISDVASLEAIQKRSVDYFNRMHEVNQVARRVLNVYNQ
jgi:glycosyltransferase involved in cell wall biosynthesis